MSDRTQKFCDLSLYSCNNGISFALLELGHMDWDFFGHGWFMRFFFAWPTGGDGFLTITVSTNQSFFHNNF